MNKGNRFVKPEKFLIALHLNFSMEMFNGERQREVRVVWSVRVTKSDVSGL